MKNNLLSLSHYKFRERLKDKAETSGKCVIIVDESFTTQICSRCHNRNKEVGSKKIYECKKCNLRTGRDVNAAKNILLKYIRSIENNDCFSC